mgnify:CR=1 FL=1
MKYWIDDLIKLGACKPAIKWARQYPTLAEAWAACDHPDWMLWLHARSAHPDPAAYAGLAQLWVTRITHTDARARCSAEAAEALAAQSAATRAAETAMRVLESGGERAETLAVQVAAAAETTALDFAWWLTLRRDTRTIGEQMVAAQCNDIRAALDCPVLGN